MSNSNQLKPVTRPWEVDVMPDMFGFHLVVDGRRFFIPRERIAQVAELLNYWAAAHSETQSLEVNAGSGE